MKNIEKFSVYTAKVFEILYAAFPASIEIDRDEMVKAFLSFDKQGQELKRDIAEIHGVLHRKGQESGAYGSDEEVAISNARKKVRELEDEQWANQAIQVEIFSGTLDFLESEGFIVHEKNKGYRLTSKSLSHLNKTFEDGKVKKGDRSYISSINDMFGGWGKPQDVVVDTAVAIIPKLLGFN